MAVDDRMRHQRLVEHHGDTLGRVVHGRERGDGTGLDAEHLAHLIGRAEREAPGGTEPPVQRLELDCGVLERRDQVERALLVLQEQVLGVAARDHAAQGL